MTTPSQASITERPVLVSGAKPVTRLLAKLMRGHTRRLLRRQQRCTPRNTLYSSRASHCSLTGLRQVSLVGAITHSPTCVLAVAGQAQCVFTLTGVRGRWLITTPGGTSDATLKSQALPSLPTYCRAAYLQVVRGLGSVCVLKLRYKGKSFKWHRRNSALMLRFGHAHLVYARAWSGVRWRRRGKMKILLFGSSLPELLLFGALVLRWRRMNVYHGRGLRLARQVVYRKSGKVSAYR